MRGKFITFEGSEGCGKSTQSRMLARYLKGRGRKVVYIREPGGTKISEKIRKILLNPQNKKISANCEMLLYMAARAQIVDEIIKPALLGGKIVICDRFLDSTVVYQGFGLGIDIQLIKKLGSFATNSLNPDLTILLDLPVKDGLKNRGSSKDRIERRSYSYHLRVRRGYLKLADSQPGRIKVIKVEKNKDETQSKIREAIKRYVI
ncbi:MAG: dTMP kinase [Candidatus Omnitrophota bacterium]